MMGAAVLGLFSKTSPPSEQPRDNTTRLVRLVANLFIVMTSLVLGLMLNSAKNTLDTNATPEYTSAVLQHSISH